MFRWRETRAGSVCAFTDAVGGVSTGPYAALNLAHHVGDEPSAVRANRLLLAESLCVATTDLVFLDQVHGRTVARVDAAPPAPVTADAAVTANPDLVLAVLVADCVPVLLVDQTGIRGVAHAGRAGMTLGVVTEAVGAMRAMGARGIQAILGPSICPRCYEVPEALAADVAATEPAARSTSSAGTPAIDVAAGVLAQLRRLGVPATRVPGCTREDPDLFSHRRSGPTGRFAGVLAPIPSGAP